MFILSLYRCPITLYQTNRSSGSHALKEKDKDAPSVRFKIQYQVVSILPLKAYDDFLKVRGVECTGACVRGRGGREREREREREGERDEVRGNRFVSPFLFCFIAVSKERLRCCL